MPTGRLLGPFEFFQLIELKKSGHIKGDEEAQIYPTGQWMPIEEFDFFKRLNELNEDKEIKNFPDQNDGTFIINLEKIRLKKNENDLNNYVQENNEPVGLLTQTIQLSPPVSDDKIQIDSKELPLLEMDLDEMDILDNSETKNGIKNESKNDSFAIENISTLEHDKTQVMSINRKLLIKEAKVNEAKLEKEKKTAIKIEKLRNKKNVELQEKDKKKTRILTITLAFVLIVFAIFFPDEGKNKNEFKYLKTKIEFPMPFDVSDEKKSEEQFRTGVEYFNKGNYVDIISAGIYLKQSYENNIENINALGLMLRCYAEELKNSENHQIDALTLFNLIQSKRIYLVQNANGVIGLSQFYTTINKPDAAIDILEKYIKIKPNEITQDIFAAYLETLIIKGKIEKSRQFFEALLKETEKNRYSYSAIINYYILNQEVGKALEYSNEAIKKYPDQVMFFLKKAELLIKKKDAKKSINLLNHVRKRNFDSNNLVRAKYYELLGLVHILRNEISEAAKLFSNSLKIKDSDSLRSLLADLEDSQSVNSFLIKDLIQESKGLKYLAQAKEFYESKNYELALSSASKASDLSVGLISADIFLSKVQLKLGLSKLAIKTIENLRKKYPRNKEVLVALIETYINTFKFNEARNQIQTLSGSEFGKSWEFVSLNARFFLRMGNISQAVSWLNKSISLNPLNSSDLFELAKIFLKISNFDHARNLLVKCMELDPQNPDIRIAYSKLLYETQDDQAAIGYLLSLKEDLGENPKILSEIAIFYYRSGRVKDFMDYKKKLEAEHFTDRSLYEFLIKSAMLDDRKSEVPALVEKLISIEPGDYEYMMIAGEALFEIGKLKDAAKWFVRLREKLPTYPKLLYFLARIDYILGDKESALKKIQEDIEVNGDYDDQLVLMAEIYLDQGKLIEAENLLKKAQKINPKSFNAILILADLSFKNNNYDLALDLYRKAMKLRETESILHKKIGDVYRQLGQGTLAIEAYKMYLEMEPESQYRQNLEAYINLMR